MKKTDFEKAFEYLISTDSIVNGAAKTYRYLKDLNHKSPKSVLDDLISSITKICFVTNTNATSTFQ